MNKQTIINVLLEDIKKHDISKNVRNTWKNIPVQKNKTEEQIQPHNKTMKINNRFDVLEIEPCNEILQIEAAKRIQKKYSM